MPHRILIAAVVAVLASAAAIALPALGADSSSSPRAPVVPDAGPPANPPDPAPAAGETDIPPVGDASEDDLPTPAEREAALAHMRDVVACARAKGATIPDPVSDGQGVHVSWVGPSNAAAEAALRECDPALT